MNLAFMLQCYIENSLRKKKIQVNNEKRLPIDRISIDLRSH